MTEGAWLVAKNPHRMLSHLAGRMTDRKVRLLICALARRVWPILSDEGRQAVAVAERLADGRCSEEERVAAFEAAGGSFSAIYTQADCIPAKALMSENLDYYCADAAGSVTQVPDAEGRYISVPTKKQVAEEAAAQCVLIREVFGNERGHQVTFPHEWRTPHVVGLARTAYDDGRFDLLGILGDALEDAGCGDPVVLAHCRQAGGHVRGCWVVDTLLGYT